MVLKIRPKEYREKKPLYKNMPGFFLDRIALQNPWWHICDSGDDFGIFGQHYPRECLFYTLWNHLICD